jgi:hypothetical protein
VLTVDRTVRATIVVTVPGRNLLVMYLVSFLAGLWVVARLVRDWRVDRTALTFHRQSTPGVPGHSLQMRQNPATPTLEVRGMPDLLTHALLPYTLCLVLAYRYWWLDAGYVTVGMTGAFIPDAAKIALVVPGERVVALLDVPFSWLGIHTFGGTVVGVLVGGVLAAPAEPRRVAALLSVEGGFHLLFDAVLRKAAGRSYPLLWPLIAYAPPTPGLYHSANVWTIPAAGTVALVVTLIGPRNGSG